MLLGSVTAGYPVQQGRTGLEGVSIFRPFRGLMRQACCAERSRASWPGLCECSALCCRRNGVAGCGGGQELIRLTATADELRGQVGSH